MREVPAAAGRARMKHGSGPMALADAGSGPGSGLAPDAASDGPGVETTVLPNGLTVASERMDHLQSVAVGIYVRAGSRDEHEDEHGLAHLLEHMAFKGTTSRSARSIAEAIEDVGGEINAATSNETTTYYARVLKDDLGLAVDVLSDIVMNPAIAADELEREQHVILQEIGAATDTPDDVVFDRFTEVAYEGQAVGRSILGTSESVERLTGDAVRRYLDRHYAADRMVLVAAGAVDHDALVREAERRLGSLPSTASAGRPVEAEYRGGEFREARDLMDAQLVLGFEGRAIHARDFYASQVLASVLGGGMSSRLFQRVREERGLCYSVYAFHWGFADTGLFGVHAATGEDDVAQLVPVIVDELKRAADDIDEAETARARAQLRAGLLMARESPSARASQIGRQLLLFDRIVPNAELLARLDAIDAVRLRDLAGRLFVGAPTLSSVGPVRHLPPRDEIARALGRSLH